MQVMGPGDWVRVREAGDCRRHSASGLAWIVTFLIFVST